MAQVGLEPLTKLFPGPGGQTIRAVDNACLIIQDKELVVRFLVDGLLQEAQRLPKWTQSAIVSRIKILSNLDIAEKRQPQDGRLMVEVAARRVDMRVSTLPTTHGEKVVIRVVDQGASQRMLPELGLYPEDRERIEVVGARRVIGSW